MTPEALFDRYNRKYFGGRLPKYAIDVSGRYIRGCCMRRKRVIYLPARAGVRGLLMHEMCHAAAGNRHGDAWMAEMRRVRALGAPVAAADISGYLPGRPETRPTTKRDVIGEIEDRVMQNRAVPIGRIVRDILYECGVVNRDGLAETADARRFVSRATKAAANERRRWARWKRSRTRRRSAGAPVVSPAAMKRLKAKLERIAAGRRPRGAPAGKRARARRTRKAAPGEAENDA
jgi:SprT-like family